MTDLTEDIVELQTRVQFQDDTIQKLDDAIIRQSEILDKLVRRMAELEDRLEQVAFQRDKPVTPDEDKPPHY